MEPKATSFSAPTTGGSIGSANTAEAMRRSIPSAFNSLLGTVGQLEESINILRERIEDVCEATPVEATGVLQVSRPASTGSSTLAEGIRELDARLAALNVRVCTISASVEL